MPLPSLALFCTFSRTMGRRQRGGASAVMAYKLGDEVLAGRTNSRRGDGHRQPAPREIRRRYLSGTTWMSSCGFLGSACWRRSSPALARATL
uniref:Predicted protein n=1 Tax=Hordeum vulgare subsp. vulgare TaxID=112509 RepID=F2DMK5_HORVV|nr:predicted protein [Hordeum vulgare subsp. vulgare]